jgi:hypothetical protein
MIQPTFISFDQAKLLKEKGFDESTNCYYFEDGEFRQYSYKDTYGYYGGEFIVTFEELHNYWNDKYLRKKNGDSCFGCLKQNGYLETFSAPEQHVVIEWLRINYGIWISVYTMDKWMSNDNHKNQIFDYSIKQMKLGLIDIPKKPAEFDSPQEAYSAAFDYILNNLI